MFKVNALTYSEIAGIPQTDTWSQVFVSEVKENSKVKGQLFFLINIVNESDEDTIALGKLIATRFEEDYYSNLEKPLLGLKSALVKIKEMADARQVSHLEIACGAVLNNILYLAKLNQAKVLVCREEKLIDLSATDEEITSFSGYLKDNDLILLSSHGFMKLVGIETVNKSLDHNTPEEIVSGLAPIVLGSLINADCALLVLSWKKEKEVEINEVLINENSKVEKQTEPLPETVASASLPFVNINFLPMLFSKLNKLTAGLTSKLLPKGKTKKTAVSVIIIILILLLTSVVLGINRKEEVKRRQEFEIVYQDAKNKYEEGKAIIGLNNTQARNYLRDASNLMQREIMKFTNKKSEEYLRASDLLTGINASLTEISGVYKVQNPEVFYDLTLIKDNAEGSHFSLSNKSLAILDDKNQSLYLLAINTKALEVLAGGKDLNNAKFITQGTDTYFYSDSNGIFKVNNQNKKIENIIKHESDQEETIDFRSFSGNLYLLTKTDIKKYIAVENGFSDPRSYLAKDIKPDFSNSRQLAIDGSVWILFDNGSFVKFQQGKPISFTLGGLDKNLNNPKRFFVSDETKNAYILDSGNNRVVVINKDGFYQAQYQWEGIKNVSDFCVSEDLKKIFLLSKNKVYAFDLK